MINNIKENVKQALETLSEWELAEALADSGVVSVYHMDELLDVLKNESLMLSADFDETMDFFTIDKKIIHNFEFKGKYIDDLTELIVKNEDAYGLPEVEKVFKKYSISPRRRDLLLVKWRMDDSMCIMSCGDVEAANYSRIKYKDKGLLDVVRTATMDDIRKYATAEDVLRYRIETVESDERFSVFHDTNFNFSKILKKYTEKELLKVSEELACSICVRNNNGEMITYRTKLDERELLRDIFFGTLLSISWRENSTQVALDTAEFIANEMYKNRFGKELFGYQSVYVALWTLLNKLAIPYNQEECE